MAVTSKPAEVALPETHTAEAARIFPADVMWLLAIGAALRVGSFLFSANAGADALDRVVKAAAWAEHPVPQFFFGSWLPLHFWGIAAFTKLFSDPMLAGRMLSLVCGIAVLPFFYRLTREVFGHSAACLSLLVFSFYSLHIAYSATSSSDSMYLLFLVAGLSEFFVYRRNNSLANLGISGLCLTAAAAIRFEAWIVIFALSLALLGWPGKWLSREFWSAANLAKLSVFGVLAGLFPVICLTYSWVKFGHPLFFVVANRTAVADQHAFSQYSILYWVAAWPVTLVLTLTFPAVVAGAWRMVASVFKTPAREFGAVALFFAAIQFYQNISGGVMPYARYTLTIGTFLAAFAGDGLLRIASRFWSLQRMRVILAAILVVNLLILLAVSESSLAFSDKIASVSPRLRFPHYIESVAAFVKSRRQPHEAIVIDNRSWETGALTVASGLSLYDSRVFRLNQNDPAGVFAFIELHHPRYVVYSDQGSLRPQLRLPTTCAGTTLIRGVTFTCRFSNAFYKVYELSYPTP